MKRNIFHPITGQAATFAHRLALEAKLIAAAKRNAFSTDLTHAARMWFGGNGGAS